MNGKARPFRQRPLRSDGPIGTVGRQCDAMLLVGGESKGSTVAHKGTVADRPLRVAGSKGHSGAHVATVAHSAATGFSRVPRVAVPHPQCMHP